MQHSAHERSDVLLVEDSTTMVRLVREAFDETSDEIDVHVVNDGVDALDFLHQRDGHAAAPRPRIVLLDLGLPGKGGKTVLRELKETAGLKHIPVIIFTDSTAKEDIDEAYDLGANAYVIKPGSFDDLLGVVEEIHDFWLTLVQQPK